LERLRPGFGANAAVHTFVENHQLVLQDVGYNLWAVDTPGPMKPQPYLKQAPIDAIQVTGESITRGIDMVGVTVEREKVYILGRPQPIPRGDWIIRTSGIITNCPDKVFRSTYKKAPNA